LIHLFCDNPLKQEGNGNQPKGVPDATNGPFSSGWLMILNFSVSLNRVH
jgi:hypothetical protein